MNADIRIVGLFAVTYCVGTCNALIWNYQNVHFTAKDILYKWNDIIAKKKGKKALKVNDDMWRDLINEKLSRCIREPI